MQKHVNEHKNHVKKCHCKFNRIYTDISRNFNVSMVVQYRIFIRFLFQFFLSGLITLLNSFNVTPFLGLVSQRQDTRLEELP